jgi:hypothetical protein
MKEREAKPQWKKETDHMAHGMGKQIAPRALVNYVFTRHLLFH